MAGSQLHAFDTDLLQAFDAYFVNRHDTYAVQHADGRYARVGQPLDREALAQHLAGERTIAPYALDRSGSARWLCFDCDAGDGLDQLATVQGLLRKLGLDSLREASRRGGHLWFFCAEPQPGWLLCSLAHGALALLRAEGKMSCEVEVYPPNSAALDGHAHVGKPRAGVGVAVRASLGVHRLTGRVYPFVDVAGRPCHPLKQPDALQWLISQPPADAAQLGNASARLIERLDSLLHMRTSAAPLDSEIGQIQPRVDHTKSSSVRRGGATSRVPNLIAWVNEHIGLPDLIVSTRSDVGLRRAGRGWVGWCPWHDDDAPQEDGRPGTPSLYVVLDRLHGWSWRCLSSNCGAHAGLMRDTFDWLVWCHGGNVGAAIAWVGERYRAAVGACG
jgi:hypothetical protein